MCLKYEVYSQSLKLGIGIVNEKSFSVSQVQIDTVYVEETNTISSFIPMPFVSFGYPISDKFLINFGFQFYRSGIPLGVYYTSDSFPSHIPYLAKGWSTATYNLEIPIGGSYRILKKNDFSVFVDLSIVPVWSVQDFEPIEIQLPNGIDWTQQIVDALNAVESIPKSFYTNYQYGLSIEYKRFGLMLFQSANVDRSISNGYTLYDTEYNLQRRIRSTRIGLYYSFGLKKEKD